MDDSKMSPQDEGSPSAASDELESSRLGDYELLEQIGQGGMGTVYRARHVLLNQTVALKVLSKHLLSDSQAVARFQREMLSTGSLNHPHLIRALNAGTDRGCHFLVTEFVDGITFRDLVEQQGPLPVGAACELVRQAAVGLQYINVNGLVHRDIKPANLMLSRDGIVKILDLGLARERSRLASRELTQTGQPMGTVDYMAPEQWLDSSSVDIRADIYSLGCTLFYLLVGKSPSQADSKETQPWKAASGRRQRLPDISSQRPDCPRELKKILNSMLAEEADDRLGDPGEVSDAIGRFADARQLDELLACVPRTAQQGAGHSGSNLSDTHATTSQRSSVSPRGVTARSISRSGARRRRMMQLCGAGAALLVVLAAGAVWWWGRPEAAPPGEPSEAEANRWAATASEICGLPGLNGLWWFDESPWLAPFVRQAIAEDLAQGHGMTDLPFATDPEDNPALSSDIEAVQDWLLGLARSTQDRLTASELPLLDELVRISQADLTDELLAGELQAALDRFVAETGPDARDSAWSAADLHMRAVLQHKIAALRSDRSLAEAAADSYAAALTAYKSWGSEADSLQARCLVDTGELYARVLKDYPKARDHYREARALPGAPLLLQVEAWTSEAVASAVANPDAAEKYAEAGFALNSAQKVLEESQLRINSHPMAAHVHERYAWILMDQWSVRKAAAEFKDARSIRFDNFWKSKNEFAQIFVFHNDHGQAMAARYSGDVKMARAQYDLVIGEVEKALAKTEAEPNRLGAQRFRRDLRERYSNSCERRADCELYQGAASGAAVDLKEAARLYALGRDYADDRAVQVTMSCKRAIVLAQAGQLADAEQEFGQEHVSQLTVIGVQEERLRLLRNLAAAVLQANGPDKESGLTALRSFLREFDLDPNYPDRHRRETQELQLFAAELLIAAELNDPAQQAVAASDADYLDRLIAAFPYRDQMLVYLRRYYNLLIAARADSDPDRAAGYILASRGQRPVPDATLVLFHFAADRGWIVVRTTDTTCRTFPLDFGRDAVKAAGTETVNAIALPGDLIELLSGERTAGRAIVVFWDDANCWARAEDALGESDWPFDRQLGYDGSIH